MGVTTDLGLEILIHVGINTVELEGKPFKMFVENGQVVKKGELLLEADILEIKNSGKKATTMVIITNMEHVSQIDNDVTS